MGMIFLLINEPLLRPVEILSTGLVPLRIPKRPRTNEDDIPNYKQASLEACGDIVHGPCPVMYSQKALYQWG